MRCRVKICGVTSVADAVMAANLGADAIGLNFYDPSPRHIDEPTAKNILDALPPLATPVMLAVDEPWDVTAARLQRLGDMLVQIHRRDMTPASGQWIPAFAIKDESSLAAIIQFLDRCRDHPPAAVLVDAHVPGSFGGTGQTAPWELLANFKPSVPFILAGGLTPQNVAEAVERVRPWMVDVASGVESSPGKKDLEKVGQFIDAVRRAG